ncbi:hypothetical protein ACIBG6_25375 [Streptomyces sp. NPDC050842]|uniref:hypothetical protein n=1 Tax=Streptomyces sp. NPDC050842 TaxID=3365636 RepID=UPI00378DF701
MADQQDGGEREPQPIDEEAAWAAIVAGYGDEPADPPGARPYRPIENLALPEPEDEPADEPTKPDAKTGTGTGTGKGTPAGSGAAETEAQADAASGADSGSGPGSGSGADTAPGPASGSESGTGTDGEASPDADRKPEAGAEKPALGSSVVFAPGVRPSGPRDYSPAEPEQGPDGSEEGHFVPPEPPPLPEADATTKFAWLGVVGGPVLMLVAVLFQWDMTWWLTTLCVGGFLGGFATLVARMKHDDDDDDGFGDPGRGAVV